MLRAQTALKKKIHIRPEPDFTLIMISAGFDYGSCQCKSRALIPGQILPQMSRDGPEIMSRRSLS